MKSGFDALASLPHAQMWLAIAATLTIAVGANLISVMHCRRLKKQWKFIGNGLAEMMDYNRTEWTLLLLVLGMSIALMAVALSV